MSRKLASIRKIQSINPIPNADNIEVATVDGWHCVVKKGEFKEGDMCVYFEPDSLLPRKDWCEFLFRDKQERFRLKTIRLRGQVSQGLALPVTILPGEDVKYLNNVDIGLEGKDVTEILDVKKYEPELPAQLQGVAKSTFPSFIPKTDEERIQNATYVLEQHYGARVYITEKVDGSSMTVYLRDGEFGVCSRRIDLKETEGNSFWAMARKLNLEEKLRKFHTDNGVEIALQGELYGSSIQKNKYKINEHRFAIFNVFNVTTGQYMDYDAMLETIKELDLEMVPFICKQILRFNSVDEIVEFAKGPSKLNPDTEREGIVVRPLQETQDRKLGRLSFKVINPEFLLKYGE
jgi:RNA ligase (TIGR02306 family)